MRYFLIAIFLCGFAGPAQAVEYDVMPVGASGGAGGGVPRRIALEQWQMARIRTGSIVECEALVKNISGDRLDNIAVAAEFYGNDGKSLGRTPQMAVDNMGDIGKVRQGLIARLASGAAELVSIRAPRIPVFAKYLVTVKYAVEGRPVIEEFEGSLSRAPERRGLDQAGGDRPEVRIVRQSLSASASLSGKPKKYMLELLLKNISILDAADLEVSLEVSAAGTPVKTLKFTLEPSVLKAGQTCLYKMDCGELPPFDDHRLAVAFKELAASESDENKVNYSGR